LSIPFLSKAVPDFCYPTTAENLQNFFGVFLQFHIGVDTRGTLPSIRWRIYASRERRLFLTLLFSASASLRFKRTLISMFLLLIFMLPSHTVNLQQAHQNHTEQTAQEKTDGKKQCFVYRQNPSFL